MDNGWIKLHRKLLNNPIIRKPSWAWLWVVLLLLANHEEEEFIWNGSPIKIKKGQFVTGRKKLKEYTGMPETTIEDVLKYLETQHQIRQQKTTKYRIISILNWDLYQKPDIISDNRATTERQQSDTNKKYKNDKKNTVSIASTSDAGWTFQDSIKKLEESPRRDLNIIAWFLEERRPDIKTRDQMGIAIKRHLRAAKELIPFTNEQLLVGLKKARDSTKEYTLETILKYLTK